MKKFSKYLVILLISLLFVTWLGISAVSQEKFKIGYDIYWLGNTWSVMLAEEFKHAVERPEYKDIVEPVYTESENDTNKMINNIEDLIAQECDAIIITPTSMTALNPVLRKAREAGIKVVLNATRVDDPEAYDALVYYDNYLISRDRMEWMARKLNYKGKVLEIVGRPLVPITGEDNNGFLKKWDWIREEQEAGNEFYYKFDSVAHAMPVYLSVTSLEVAIKLLKGIPVEFEQNYDFPKAILEQGIGLIAADQLDEYVKPDLPDSINTLTTLTDEELREIFKE